MKKLLLMKLRWSFHPCLLINKTEEKIKRQSYLIFSSLEEKGLILNERISNILSREDEFQKLYPK
ncbi:MAG: hypothetical protein KGZ42_01545 [Melioribacter sp.]|nr:hypothetical protein [Melioribacter sp.]